MRQTAVFAHEHAHLNASDRLRCRRCWPGRRGPGELLPVRLRRMRSGDLYLDGITRAGVDGIVGELRLHGPSRGQNGRDIDLSRLCGVVAGQEVEYEFAAFFRGRFGNWDHRGESIEIVRLPEQRIEAPRIADLER